jgi:iron complex outermembrane receptor protein
VGILGCPALFSNVGSVTSRGAEATCAEADAGPGLVHALSWNDSTYDNDYVNNGVVPTREAKTVDTPNGYSPAPGLDPGPLGHAPVRPTTSASAT